MSKTGPNKEVMQNSRLSLTLIGLGSTNVKPHIIDPKEISHRVNNTRKTIVKVIFLLYLYLHVDSMYQFNRQYSEIYEKIKL